MIHMTRHGRLLLSRRARSTSRCWLYLPLTTVALALVTLATAHADDHIVLRDLTLLRDPAVVSLDEEGIVLSHERPAGQSGTRVAWDEIERVQLADVAQQQQAERSLREIGLPLYRLRVRLELGDDVGLREPAESLWGTFAEHRSQASYRVLQSLVWGRLAQGEREAALEPWLLAYEVLRSRAAKVSDLPGSRRPEMDSGAALLGELSPLWFDAEAARDALPKAEKALGTFAEPIPSGAKLYLASLALAAGDLPRAEPYLAAEVPPQSASEHLRTILHAQREVLQNKPQEAHDRLRRLLAEIESQLGTDQAKARLDYRPLALYWLGRAQQAAAQGAAQEEGLLTMMQIPALYGEQAPEVAAAALFTVAEAYAADAPLAAKLRAALRDQFPGTWHARHIAASEAATR